MAAAEAPKDGLMASRETDSSLPGTVAEEYVVIGSQNDSRTGALLGFPLIQKPFGFGVRKNRTFQTDVGFIDLAVPAFTDPTAHIAFK